jgi:hypothetical protein
MSFNNSFWVSIAFILTTLFCAMLVYFCLIQSKAKVTRLKANKIFIGIIIWLVVQLIISSSNIYTNYAYNKPPLIFLLGILPVMLGIVYLFFSPKGKAFIQTLPLEYLTNVHIIRIPVEFILYCLFMNKLIPKGMTFLGYNFDIIIGITAPLISFFFFRQKNLSRIGLLIWNCIGLLFLLHIVLIGILSAPSVIQQLNFNQPNKAVLQFPYIWLVSFIVPVVMLCHLISIKRLLKDEDYEVALPSVSEFYKS